MFLKKPKKEQNPFIIYFFVFISYAFFPPARVGGVFKSLAYLIKKNKLALPAWLFLPIFENVRGDLDDFR